MEHSLEFEYPKRNRGRPKQGEGKVRPDFKILQFDWSTVGIRANQANDSMIIEDDSNNESKSNPKEKYYNIVFDGRKIYNNSKVEDLVDRMKHELNTEEIIFPIVDKTTEQYQH